MLPLQPPRVMVADTYVNIPAIFARLNSEERIPGTYLIRGLIGSGKTHLLYALSHKIGAQYCPLKIMLPAGSAALEGYESPPVLCIDDLDFSLQSSLWVEQVQALVRQRAELHYCTIISTCALHDQMDPFCVDSIESVTLTPLTMAEKVQAVVARGKYLGIKIELLSGEWLVKQFGDDMHRLMDAVKQLSKALPQQSKRISVKRLGMMKREGAFDTAS